MTAALPLLSWDALLDRFLKSLSVSSPQESKGTAAVTSGPKINEADEPVARNAVFGWPAFTTAGAYSYQVHDGGANGWCSTEESFPCPRDLSEATLFCPVCQVILGRGSRKARTDPGPNEHAPMSGRQACPARYGGQLRARLRIRILACDSATVPCWA